MARKPAATPARTARPRTTGPRRPARARSHPAAFAALSVEGALIAPAMLARIATREAAGQTDTDYRIPKGLTLRDEIARHFRIGQALFAELHAAATPSPAATVRFVEAFLRDVLGFPDIARIGSRTLGERLHPVTLEGLGGRVPVLVVPPAEALDAASAHLPGDGRRRSAASALQDWLNASDGAMWGIACNGLRLRLLRDNASLTRPAYVEADLRVLFEGEAFADFAAFWLLCHATRFGAPDRPPAECPLERWREEGAKAGEAARDRLRDGVEAALLALGNGFLAHPGNRDLLARIQDGSLPLPAYFQQLLRLVYRLIFLFAAEDRDLLHPPGAPAAARSLYAAGYSLANLRDRAARKSARDAYDDRWEGLRIVFAALARGEPRLGLPALGGLFAPDTMPDLDVARLHNRALMDAIWRLAWLAEDGATVPVNWRDMETEELGSVYESLLELTPQLTADGRGLAFAEGAEGKGHARKTTGSYYTPDSLVKALLDSALDPVLDRVERTAPDPIADLLELTILDPACGSGHFLLGAARRVATRLARQRKGGLATPDDYRHALRDVVRACIHGVDRNPMAVELAKVALWIETVEPGRPLGFLDANIRCGDSLLGIFDLEALRQGVPDDAYKPLTGDDRETARHFAARNKAERKGQGRLDFTGGGGTLPAAAPLARTARDLRAMPEDSPAEVAARRTRFEGLRHDPAAWRLRIAADLYTAAFLLPKTGGAPANHQTVTIPTTAHVWEAMAGRSLYGPLVGRGQDLAAAARAFHWPLEFPDIMARGGFDVVLGNPPWDRIKLQEQEFFAARDPAIAAAPTTAERGRMIAALSRAPEGTRERALHEEFEQAKRTAEASSGFARAPAEDGGRFPLTGKGDVNTYALFAELSVRVIRFAGRAGIIVPTGIAMDATTAPFFRSVLDQRALISLHDFQTGLGFFDRIGHARYKFCLLTLGSPGSGPESAAFSFFSRTAEEFADPRRHFTISADLIALANPNTRTAPVFRTRADAELAAKIYDRVPVLIDEAKGAEGNPWGLSFLRMFDMSNDSGLFRTAAQLRAAGCERDGAGWVARTAPATGNGPEPERWVPLYEAKMIHQFDHRWATYDGADSRDTTAAEKSDPAFEPTPRYWVPEPEVTTRLADKAWTRGWLMGWRDICRATDERTVIASAFPRAAVGNKLPLMFPGCPDEKSAALIGCLSSIVLDYVARQKIGGTTLNYFILYQFSTLPPSSFADESLAFIVPRILELTYTSRAMAPFARDLGHDGPPFAWDENHRARLRAELDAFYARAYGLTRDELRYILDPADAMGPDYPSETFRVLKKNDIARFGEYRTARLVLAAWDEQEAAR